jgi:hypothetical protein
MKKIIFLALLVAVASSCKDEKKYQTKLGSTLDSMTDIIIISAVYIDAIKQVWHTAIYDKEYLGKFCGDFNNALADYVPKLHSTQGYIDLKGKANHINIEVKGLSDYPAKYKDAYSEIAEIAPLVKEYFNLANSPTGSITSYSTRSKELFSQINNKISTMKLKYID